MDTYNPGQSKIRNKSSPSPQINDEHALKPNRTIFFLFIVEMRGGVVLTFHLN